MKPRILIIEDDASTAASVQKVLCAEGYAVDHVGRGDEGLAQALRGEYSLVITDLRLPGLGGLELVAQLHTQRPKQAIILMTAHGTTETAIEATKQGACDYLLKPFEADELLDLVASAVASSRLMTEPVEMGEAHSDRSAFTGAHARRIGRFEQAQGGTIFLDEIGDLNASTQGKLLRVLQERCIQRLGSETNVAVDVRVLAATHRDLEAAIKEKEFREDLFYRLSVVTITLPSLSDRPDDIPQLAKYFIRRFGKELGQESQAVQAEAISFLQSQS